MKVTLITPPFTQLNTPYPATAYLRGFLEGNGIYVSQADLGIETMLAIFSASGLAGVFALPPGDAISENARRIWQQREVYVATIDSVIRFLQGAEPALASRICNRGFLPEAARFADADTVKQEFGAMGRQDYAKYLATMYLEDIADFISECVDPHFGLSRYAERLSRSANTFDELQASLYAAPTYIDEVMTELLRQHIEREAPGLVGCSVPFPGNLYAALRCGWFLKKNYPGIKVAMGGGYPNTELRSLTDPRVFDFVDFITLDDGEAPLLQLARLVAGQCTANELRRTFLRSEGKVLFIDNADVPDYKMGQMATPDYTDLPLHRYVSAIEVANPMHSLWSDGLWLKLTMAHGCYWGKCTFCDTSLDYISRYEPLSAAVLCDRVEELIARTGCTGFHFVDEAAPPVLMRSFALEVIRRGLVISWWTNIRFEKSFSRDLCLLLRASGCIAVSGGLEVASDRLLQLIDKGVTVAQVARVNQHFTAAGIMVHAYLMYGFPTQTAQETIDSLEMVRQMFRAGIMQSAFWHRFAMTAHSPAGIDPARFRTSRQTMQPAPFANNDVEYDDPTGADHDAFGEGLRKSLHNYMHGSFLEQPLHKWFDFKVPRTAVDPAYIDKVLNEEAYTPFRPTARVVWLGSPPVVEHYTRTHKGTQWEMTSLTFFFGGSTTNIRLNRGPADWLCEQLPVLSPRQLTLKTLQQLAQSFEQADLGDFELFWSNKPMNTMYKAGLLVL